MAAMKLCYIAAPGHADAASSAGRSRPILAVKYLGQVQSYATFRDGQYEFRIDETLCEAITDGRVAAAFQLDEEDPVGIVLKDVEESGSGAGD